MPLTQPGSRFDCFASDVTVGAGRLYLDTHDGHVLALDPASGARLWNLSTLAPEARSGNSRTSYGWSWGQPAVTQARVVVGTAAASGYVSGHRAGILALDRTTGRPVWRYDVAPAESGTAGFPGSPALGADLVFLAGLDGRVYAFRP